MNIKNGSHWLSGHLGAACNVLFYIKRAHLWFIRCDRKELYRGQNSGKLHFLRGLCFFKRISINPETSKELKCMKKMLLMLQMAVKDS